jgi:PAS domain S-box-containing protein
LTITIIDKERVLDDDEFIVSKTDIKGKITYANRVFMSIAGYAEHQLLGQPHSIIRHPDMPRGAFYFLWNTLQEGNEFFAYVKNLCANGQYYWVFANVTLDYDEDQVLSGYYSVRRKPSQRAIDTVTPFYREMLAIESRSSGASAPKASAEYLMEQLDKLGVSYEQFIFSLV